MLGRETAAYPGGSGPGKPHPQGLCGAIYSAAPALAAGASTMRVAKSAGDTISSTSKSSEQAISRCLMPGTCRMQSPLRMVCWPCPSYSKVAQPLSTYTSWKVQSCTCHCCTWSCTFLPLWRMRWATKSPLLPALMPRSRYSKISRSPGVHVCSLARLCTKSHVFCVMVLSCGFLNGLVRLLHYSACARHVIAGRSQPGPVCGLACDSNKRATQKRQVRAQSTPTRRLDQAFGPANDGNDRLFALKQPLGNAL